jgi:hypothetical protein
MTNITHMAEAVRTKRIPVDDAPDECLADAILNHEALRLRIIRLSSRSEQRIALVEHFTRVAAEGWVA